jgi:hypothetical protein
MTMTLAKTVRTDAYTETEAARVLNVSIARLHQLLDEHIFNGGRHRPPDLEFNGSDLLLLAYWSKECPQSPEPRREKVVMFTRPK